MNASDNSNIAEYLDFAISMAKRAGEIHLKYFRKRDLEMNTKLNVYDVVTVADRESEKYIIGAIKQRYPQHGIIAEESGSDHEECEYRWVIDPLDGTTNFSQGLPIFCVSIALEIQGESVLGVVYAPYLGELFTAVKGKGSYLNGQPLRCNTGKDLARSVVSTGFPYDKQVNPDNNIEEASRVIPLVRGLRRLGSAAIDLCYVAAGYLDAYWELDLKHWDVAAGQLIAKEAGVKICSLRENRHHSILASAPDIFEDMGKLLGVNV